MQMGLRVSELRWPFGEKGKEKSQQLWSLGTVEGWMWKWEAAAPVREATCLAELVLWTRGRLSERSPLSSFNFQQRSWWPWAEQTLHRPDWGPSGQAEAGRAPQSTGAVGHVARSVEYWTSSRFARTWLGSRFESLDFAFPHASTSGRSCCLISSPASQLGEAGYPSLMQRPQKPGDLVTKGPLEPSTAGTRTGVP